jgi:hypothetical protein
MAPPCLSGEPQLLIHRRRNNPDHPTDISDRYRTSETGRAKSQSSTLTRGVGFCSHPTLPIRLLIGVSRGYLRNGVTRFTGLFFLPSAQLVPVSLLVVPL